MTAVAVLGAAALCANHARDLAMAELKSPTTEDASSQSVP